MWFFSKTDQSTNSNNNYASDNNLKNTDEDKSLSSSSSSSNSSTFSSTSVSETKTKLWNVTRDGMYNYMEHAPSIYKDNFQSKFYRAEKRIVMKHKDPFVTTVYVTIFLFATLRISGSRWWSTRRPNSIFSKLIGSFQTSNVSKQSSTSSHEMMNNSRKEFKSYLDKKAEIRESHTDGFWRLTGDILLSAVSGFSCIFLLANPRKMIEDFSDLPLVPGSSAFHKYTCPDLEKVFDEINPEIFDQNKNDAILCAYRRLAQNCQLRTELIRSREADGMDLPDFIPYPGVKRLDR